MDDPPLARPDPWDPDRAFVHDLLARLHARRQVFLSGPLDLQAATRATAELLTLEADGPDPITLHVHSSGGPLTALFTVVDTLQAMTAPVDTFCAGHAAGSAAALVALGTGTRRIAPHAQLTVRLPVTEVTGTADDVQRIAGAEATLRNELLALLSATTGQPAQRLAADWERGRVLSAEEARAAGLADEVAHPAGSGPAR